MARCADHPIGQSCGVHPSTMCSSRISSRLQQCFYGAAFIHRSVALSYLSERQGQIENLAGVDFPVQNQLDQLRQVAANRGRSTVQVNVSEEQLLTVERDTVRHANVAHKPA